MTGTESPWVTLFHRLRRAGERSPAFFYLLLRCLSNGEPHLPTSRTLEVGNLIIIINMILRSAATHVWYYFLLYYYCLTIHLKYAIMIEDKKIRPHGFPYDRILKIQCQPVTTNNWVDGMKPFTRWCSRTKESTRNRNFRFLDFIIA